MFEHILAERLTVHRLVEVKDDVVGRVADPPDLFIPHPAVWAGASRSVAGRFGVPEATLQVSDMVRVVGSGVAECFPILDAVEHRRTGVLRFASRKQSMAGRRGFLAPESGGLVGGEGSQRIVLRLPGVDQEHRWRQRRHRPAGRLPQGERIRCRRHGAGERIGRAGMQEFREDLRPGCRRVHGCRLHITLPG